MKIDNDNRFILPVLLDNSKGSFTSFKLSKRLPLIRFLSVEVLRRPNRGGGSRVISHASPRDQCKRQCQLPAAVTMHLAVLPAHKASTVLRTLSDQILWGESSRRKESDFLFCSTSSETGPDSETVLWPFRVQVQHSHLGKRPSRTTIK